MKKGWFIAAAIAALGMGTAPAFAADGSCTFRGGGAALGFATLDPSAAATVTVPITLGTLEVGDCNPKNQTLTITADNGENFGAGSRRMANGSGSYIAYSLSGLPLTANRPGNNAYATFTFNGTVLGTAYENAMAGSYSDRVIISVTP
jgi:spore coat protein U-like protein